MDIHECIQIIVNTYVGTLSVFFLAPKPRLGVESEQRIGTKSNRIAVVVAIVVIDILLLLLLSPSLQNLIYKDKICALSRSQAQPSNQFPLTSRNLPREKHTQQKHWLFNLTSSGPCRCRNSCHDSYTSFETDKRCGTFFLSAKTQF